MHEKMRECGHGGVYRGTFLVGIFSVLLFGCGTTKLIDNQEPELLKPTTLKHVLHTYPYRVFMLNQNGDAILIDHGDQEIIIDAGKHDGMKKFLLKLKEEADPFSKKLHSHSEKNVFGASIELAVATHRDQDHWLGFKEILGENCSDFPTTEFWESGYFVPARPRYTLGRKNLAKYKEFLGTLREREGEPGCPTVRSPLQACLKGAQDGVVYELPGVSIKVLHTDADPTTDHKRIPPLEWINFSDRDAYLINNASIVLSITMEGYRFLFAGDINGTLKGEHKVAEVERELINTWQGDKENMLNSNVLKVSHHGSDGASNREFLHAVFPKTGGKSPRFALISFRTVPVLGLMTHPAKKVQKKLVKEMEIPTFVARKHIAFCGWGDGRTLTCGYVKEDSF